MKKNTILLTLLLFYFSNLFAQDIRPAVMKQLIESDSIKIDSLALIKLEGLVQNNKLSVIELLSINSRIIQRANTLQQFQKSVKMALEGITLAKNNRLDSLHALFNILAGVTNYYMDRRPECIPYFMDAIRIAQHGNLWSLEARALHNVAGAQTDIKQYKQAEENLLLSLQIRKEHGQEQSHEYLLSMRVLATLYERTGRPEKVDEIYEELIRKARQMNDPVLLASNLMFYSQNLNRKGKLKEAYLMSAEAVENLRGKGDFHGLIGALLIHAKNLEDAGLIKEALQFEREAFVIQRNTFLSDLDKQIGEMEVKYKTTEKENRIKLQSVEIEKQKSRTIFLIVSFVMILLLGLLLFNRYRLKARQQAQEEKIRLERLRSQSIIRSQEEERNRVSRELHDGLGQMLSAARLNLASVQLQERPLEFQRALDLIDDSCEEVRNISHDLMPALLVRSGLIPAVEELSIKMNTNGKLSLFVEHDNKAEPFPKETEIHLFRIIQEILNNSVKHSGANEVHIQFTNENDHLSLMIEDNGKGFDTKVLAQSKGNGWNNIQSRLSLIGGTIEVDSRMDYGTVFHVEVPFKKKPTDV